MKSEDYRYEAFISYRHKKLVTPWVAELFTPLFRELLTEALAEWSGGCQARIFLDTAIDAGQPFPQALHEGLLYSRCLVAVLNGEYFYSKWCKAEWETFTWRNDKTSKSLIVPLRLQDCNELKLQYDDFEKWRFLYGPVEQLLKKGRLKPAFMNQLSEFAGRVAGVIKNGPTFDSTWQVFEPPPDEPPPIRMPRW